MNGLTFHESPVRAGVGGQVYARHARRLRWLSVALVPVAAAVVTACAWLAGLPAAGWDMLAVPLLTLLPIFGYSVGARLIARPLIPLLGERWLLPVTVAIPTSISVIAFMAVWSLLWQLLDGTALWRPLVFWLPRALPAVAIVFVVLVTAYFTLYARLLASFVEIDRRRSLERYLPEAAVERVLKGDHLDAAGRRLTATIVFADLRDSTGLIDALAAAEALDLVAKAVGAMADSVFASDGALDKYLGDGVMAIFGLIDDGLDGAAGASQCVLAMRARFAQLNANRPVADRLRFGMGIHTGEVIVGPIGVPRRMDFTAVGPAVHIAARLESLCKRFGVDNIVSGETARRLPPAIRLSQLGAAEPIRGASAPVEVWSIL